MRDQSMNWNNSRLVSSKIESELENNSEIIPISSNASECSAWSPQWFSPIPSPFSMSPRNDALPGMSPLKPYAFHSYQSKAKCYACISSMLKADGHILSIAVANRLLYTASQSKAIRVWKYPKFGEYSRFKSGSGTVRALLATQDQILSAHQDHKIRVWRRSRSNPGLHRRVATLPTFKDKLHNFIRPRNFASGHTDVVSSLAYNAADGLLYSGSWDKTVKVWKMADLKCIETIRAHNEAINAVAVGHDGLLFTASNDSTVKVWRKVVGQSIHALTMTLPTQYSPVNALALCRLDGAVVYAGCSDGCINYWEKGQLISSQMRHAGFLRGHTRSILCLATVANLVLSGSADTTIRVWMREMGSTAHCCLAVLEGHTSAVTCIAATMDNANGCLVYSGSLDGTVKVWLACIENQLDSGPLHDEDDSTLRQIHKLNFV